MKDIEKKAERTVMIVIGVFIVLVQSAMYVFWGLVIIHFIKKYW